MKIKIINPVPDLEKETVEAMRRYLAASLEAGTCIEFEPVARAFVPSGTEAQV